jgi:hypothetical protein
LILIPWPYIIHGIISSDCRLCIRNDPIRALEISVALSDGSFILLIILVLLRLIELPEPIITKD